MKKHFGGLALASLVLSTCVFALVAMHSGYFGENEENESPGDGDFAAIRLGYHGDPTDFRVEPRWFVESARQEKQIARGVPGGARTYARSSDSPQALDPNAFTLLGPQPLTGEAFGSTTGAAGRVNAIVSDPDNTAVAFIGADGGGIWKTTNCCSTSTTWTVKTDFPELASMAIDDITMDPGNHNLLYAGTGDLNYGSFSFGAAGVLKSSDRGETWSLLGTDVFTMMYPPSAGGYPQYQAVGKVVVDPNNSNNVIAGTKTGLYFSNDAGVNWTGPCYTNAFSSGGSPQRQDMTGLLAVNVSGATRLYAAVGTRGNSTPVQPDLGNNGANGVYSASMPASGCPAVAAWTLLSSGMPAGLGNGSPNTTYGRIEIAAAASDPQSLYALIADIGSSGIYGIYRTSNGGTSWTKLTNPDGTQPDSGTKVGTQMWYDSGLTVSPTNANTFFVSTVDLLISKDGGSTYTNLTSAYSGGPVHPDNHSRAVVGGDANKLINGNDGGAYYISNATTATSSSTATWVQMNSQLPTIEVYGGDITANFTAGSGSVAAGFQDNGSAYKVFSGTPVAGAWNANNSGDGFYSRIEPVLGTRFYSSVYYGQIYAGSRTAQSSIAGAWGSGSPTTTDRKSFLTAFDIYRYGSTSIAGSGCTTASGCTRLIYGTYRLWETIAAGSPTSSWKAKTGDLTKNNLIVGTDNRSYIQQLHYSFTDPTIAIAGTSDGNVQYVFNLGSGVANDATAVNVTGGNAVLPNRTIQDVSTDPVNPLIGYAAVAGFAANTPSTPGHVFRITCSANCASFTWVDKSGNLPDIPADAVIPNPNLPNQVFVGTDWGLYYTDDITVAAPVWQRFEGLPHVMVWSFTIDRGYTTLAAYTRGRGVWAWPLPTSVPTTHTVTPSVTGNGTIAPNTSQTVNDGATTAFTVTANANNHIVNVTGTCGGTLVGNTYTTNAITANCTVIANFAIDTHVVTPSVTGNGSITPNTPQTVTHGATTAFTVTPIANNHLVNVTGTCGGALVGNTYTTNAIGADCTVIANFAIDTHVVTPIVAGNGSITPNTPQAVNHGSTTAFTVTPNAGNHLVNVTGTCGGALAGNTYTTNAITADCTVIANFNSDTHIVTPSVTGNGTITPNTPQTINDGLTTAFTVAANAGSHLGSVTGTCGGTLVGNTYTTNAISADCTVIANFAVDGAHLVTPGVTGNGAITPNTPQSVADGTTTAFTLTPNANNHLVNVTGTCGGLLVGSTYTTNAITVDCTVIANFAIDTHVVTPSVSGNGAIAPNTPQTVNHGATTAFTVTPNANNHIVNVTGTCGGTLVGNTYTTNAVRADCTVIANFAIDTHVVTPSVTGNGSITPNTPQNVNHGATTAFAVTANANNHIVNVTGTCGGALVGNTYTTNAVTADCTVIANFAIDTHVVTPSVTGNGSITPNTPQNVNHGATTAFAVTANANNHIVNVTGTCGGALVGNTYTTNAITADCTVIANFAIDTHVVTPSVTGNGTIAPNTAQTVNHGATTAFTVAANANNHLVNVTGTCGGTLAGNTYTTNTVSADCTVIANFAIDTHVVTPSVTGNGAIAPNTAQTVNHGATTAFTLTANANNHLVDVTGTCGGNLVGNTYTTNAVTADCTVIANFALNVLVFTTQPTDVSRGNLLNTVAVTEQDGSGNTISDNATVTFTINVCGGPLTLGSVAMVNGVATLNATQHFYTLASGITIAASASSLNGTSAAFNVVADANYLFADGFEGCRP